MMRHLILHAHRFARIGLATCVACFLQAPEPAGAQADVPLCQAVPRVEWGWTVGLLGPIAVVGATEADRVMEWLEPYADSRLELEDAVRKLRDSIPHPDSAVAVHLARLVRHENPRWTRVVLAAFQGLELDPTPLKRLLTDYALSPQTRWEVLDVLDKAAPDSGLVEGVLVSTCQLTAWVVGSGTTDGPYIDPHDRLLRASTQAGASFYLALLRFMEAHWGSFGQRTTCKSLPACLGAARWVYDDLVRP